MKKKKNYKSLLALAIFILLLVNSCTAKSQDIHNSLSGPISGFWNGIWHGMISLITLIMSCFDKNIAMYDINNNGAWYNFGFLIGVGCSGYPLSLIRKSVENK